jgi:alkylhydroperoxidase family enzyme
MFIQHLVDATPQCEGQSDLRRLFVYDSNRTTHLLQFTQAVMRGPGPLSPGERELIAAMTSQENFCPF